MNQSMFKKTETVTVPKVIVQLYCGVPYVEKDIAKSKGAKWDMDDKAWYFQYNLDDFNKNKELNTYTYKPLKQKILNFEQYEDDVKYTKVLNNIYIEVNNRWLDNCKQLKV